MDIEDEPMTWEEARAVAKRDYVVVGVSEEGFTDIFGPYIFDEAKDVAAQLAEADTSQKMQTYVERLSLYEEAPIDQESWRLI